MRPWTIAVLRVCIGRTVGLCLERLSNGSYDDSLDFLSLFVVCGYSGEIGMLFSVEEPGLYIRTDILPAPQEVFSKQSSVNPRGYTLRHTLSSTRGVNNDEINHESSTILDTPSGKPPVVDGSSCKILDYIVDPGNFSQLARGDRDNVHLMKDEVDQSENGACEQAFQEDHITWHSCLQGLLDVRYEYDPIDYRDDEELIRSKCDNRENEDGSNQDSRTDIDGEEDEVNEEEGIKI
ncbi:hypothetical protein GGR53DRAFT_470629 [Hypoxylon sp. FL1150]|nr:hypothetical protein GGR53DRAFT_470629 [Hypoxylon sp. FL1150]